MIIKIADKIYNIEINNNDSIDSLERNMYSIKSDIRTINEYNPITIRFSINNFTFEDNDNTIEEYYIGNQEYIVTDKIKFIFIYIPNIRKKYYDDQDLSNFENFLLLFSDEDIKKMLQKLLDKKKVYRRLYGECFQ